MPADRGLVMHRFSCPICKKKIPAEEIESSAVFPFCSERCKLVDLGQWLNGTYVVPGDAESPGQSSDEDN